MDTAYRRHRSGFFHGRAIPQYFGGVPTQLRTTILRCFGEMVAGGYNRSDPIAWDMNPATYYLSIPREIGAGGKICTSVVSTYEMGASTSVLHRLGQEQTNGLCVSVKRPPHTQWDQAIVFSRLKRLRKAPLLNF